MEIMSDFITFEYFILFSYQAEIYFIEFKITFEKMVIHIIFKKIIHISDTKNIL